ncbi:response regulator [Fulvivirgaceae bacterium PWU4]|uniref:Response regulator n=1 Tax=Chryseosolibacter histidini TaxID=2782349 RepID=A0AAP2GR00_9BACT|nr:response regulator [Chryseosolibacter histidini]MBT1699505.1 response regulator [Chryseosolibacter histidini]
MEKIRIIIIEDDPDLRALMTLALVAQRFEVTSFSEADAFLKQGKGADLYIIDINLGGVSGLDLCQKIKESSNSRPVVIMISANPDINNLAQEASADDALPKPFNSKDLLNKVMNHIAAA